MSIPHSDSPYAVVVDDDYIVCMHASSILDKAGFRIITAGHGEAALELLKVQYPEVKLLFTDVRMPGQLDGFVLAREVAACWPHISIVVTSGHVSPNPGDLPDKARFISKPFSADLIYAHLQEMMPEGQQPKPLKQID